MRLHSPLVILHAQRGPLRTPARSAGSTKRKPQSACVSTSCSARSQMWISSRRPESSSLWSVGYMRRQPATCSSATERGRECLHATVKPVQYVRPNVLRERRRVSGTRAASVIIERLWRCSSQTRMWNEASARCSTRSFVNLPIRERVPTCDNMVTTVWSPLFLKAAERQAVLTTRHWLSEKQSGGSHRQAMQPMICIGSEPLAASPVLHGLGTALILDVCRPCTSREREHPGRDHCFR
jgi:hypothetical protein